MHPRSISHLATMTFAVVLLLAQGSGPARAGAFSGMEGNWSGDGALSKSDGSRERLRCRAEYETERQGEELNLHIRCASDSYNFDLTGYATNSGGSVSGRWSETTLNSAGTLSGRAGGGEVQVQAIGSSFSARLSISTSGSRQSMTIMPQGTDVSRVTLTLRRR